MQDIRLTPEFRIREIGDTDAHRCRCEACEPNIIENSMIEVIQRARLLKQNQIEGVELENLIDFL